MKRALLLGMLLAGCRGEGAPTMTAAKAAVAEAPAAPVPVRSLASLERADAPAARQLALQNAHGNEAVDVLVASLQRAAERNPRKGELWVQLGRAWVRKARETTDPGFYLNAQAAADTALDVDPGDAAALDLEGLVLLNAHRFEAARALARRTLERRPDDPAALGTLSDASLELGFFDDAVLFTQQMVDLKPNLPSYSRASHLRWLQGDVEGSKQIARLAVDAGGDARDPEPRAWALAQAAYIFLHEGDGRRAAEGFERALAQMPGYAPAVVGQGRVALARGDGQLAARLLEQAYRASPLVETAWLLGDALTVAGDGVAAEEAYRRVERTGKQVDRRTLAAFWATKNVNAAEALALAEAEEQVRADIYTEDVHAWALYRCGRLAEARTAADHALALGTRDARLLYHAGAIRVAAGDLASGLRLVDEALRLEPNFDVTGAAEARRLLESHAARPSADRHRS